MIDRPKKEKMQKEELEKVAGGLTEEEKKDIHDSVDKLIKSKGFMDIECQYCHKTFPYSKFLYFDWSGIDLDGSHCYDVHTCPECKKVHPFVSKFDDIRKK